MEIFTTAAILLSFLGHDDFRAREEAEQKLKEMGHIILPVLNYGAKSQDFEVAARCNRLRRDMWLSTLDKMEMPWVDCIAAYNNWNSESWPDIGYVQSHYLKLAHENGHNAVAPIWKDYREATRLLCRDLIYNGQSLENVNELLEAMWTRHNTYNMKTGRYETPPEQIGAPMAQKD